jgi:hypothetical protein
MKPATGTTRRVAVGDVLLEVPPDFTSHGFDGLHHLNTSHPAEPNA